MKKTLKTQITKDKIINAALKEFGQKSYDGASINQLCQDNGIAKGLIYHNFKDKDDLYLTVVKLTYDAVEKHFNEIATSEGSIQDSFSNLIQERERFFSQNHDYRNIFFASMLTPPKHLVEKIDELRHGYNQALKKRYLALLKRLKLRPNVSVEKAVNYFMIFQQIYNGYFKTLVEYEDIDSVIDKHESQIGQLLDIVLYGISERNE